MVRNYKKRGKSETHMVGHEIWRETLKNGKKRNTNVRTWNIARKSGIREILRNTDYSTWILGKKTEIRGK